MTDVNTDTVSDERLREMVGMNVPCVPANPGEVAALVQELIALRRIRSTLIEPAPGGEEVDGDKWVLRKRGLFWRPNSQGYTSSLAEAGLYTDEESTARAKNPDVIRMRYAEALKVYGAALRRPETDKAGVREGWKLVPVEPTIEMLDAMPSLPAIKLADPLAGKLSPHQYMNRVRYLAALSASPLPPEGEPASPPAVSREGVIEALQPFAEAFTKADDPGVSDLYDEQPFSLHVTLGAWRRLRSVWRALAQEGK